MNFARFWKETTVRDALTGKPAESVAESIGPFDM